ncbi:unnamed protein product [Rhizoctonia solani]|uniref:Uncharacterized protein n=1 Tax=Rhizoctonia solani TaxID=456999 RepID=A0A8H3B9K3_9AGAM|nr:unnamed protein product [Rhizoctonia solani]
MKFSFAALFTLALSPCLVSASPLGSHLNSTLPEVHLATRAETTQKFASYAAASVGSCKWVNQGKAKVVPKNLVLYTSRLKSSPGYNKVVGLGLKTNAGSITPLVRIDMDNTGKGIHFNAVQFDNSEQKLAAVLTSTVGLTQAARTSLYLDYLKGIENRSPEFLWNWWSTGKAN